MSINRIKKSMILMGINYNKAAKLKAFKDIMLEEEGLADLIEDLDATYSNKANA